MQDTFTLLSVDGDPSPNDTLLVLANGLAGNTPVTFISIRWVAPSPSPAIFTARSRHTVNSASLKVLYASLPAATGALPARPLASSSSVSLVLVSPSTEIMLKVSGTTALSAL